MRRGRLVLSEGLRPSDSPTRSLARRFAGSLRSRGSLATLARVWLPICALLMVLRPTFGEAQGRDLLRYVVRPDPFEVQLTLPDGTVKSSRPPRETTHFEFTAEEWWPVPDGPRSKQVRCVVDWIGFSSDWRLANSFGIDERTQRFETTLGALREALFAGGSDLRVTRTARGVFLVTRGTWRFADQQLAGLIDRLATAFTSVWQDRGLSGHLVLVFPMTRPPNWWEGQGRTRATQFHLSAAAETPDAFGVAHEIFHEWNGRRLNRPDDEQLYWFTEGVTDYYAALTLWRLRIWDLERLLETFNTAARQYFGSPARNYTAARMVQERKANFDVERLPYLQGFLLAAHWNSDGRVLDRAMRQLIRTNQQPLSNTRIAAALEGAGIPNALTAIDRFVVRGETIELRPRIWGDCAVESVSEIKHFDVGFDFEASRKSGKIQSARENSNAWRAGVRDGQAWSTIDFVSGDPGYLAEFELRDENGTRRVRFYPASPIGSRAPQYAASPAPCRFALQH